MKYKSLDHVVFKQVTIFMMLFCFTLMILIGEHVRLFIFLKITVLFSLIRSLFALRF